MKEVFCEVRCLKSNEEMTLVLSGQFKQLSHMHLKNFQITQRDSNPRPLRYRCSALICDAGAVLSYETTETNTVSEKRLKKIQT